MRSANRRLVIAGLVVLVIAFGFGLYLALKPAQNNGPKLNSYQDPWTGQVVTDPEGKDVDVYGTNKDQPIYLGLEKLTDHGLSHQQIQHFKTAILKYSQDSNAGVKEVSIKVDNIVDNRNMADPNAPTETTFDIKFNRKDVYKAKIEYYGITDIRLYLSEVAGQLIYDSGTIEVELID